MKWVIIREGDGYAVGPFANRDDAQAYFDSDPDPAGARLMEVSPPAQDWRRDLNRAKKAKESAR